MHFATFAGSDVEAFEPIVELSAEREKRGIPARWEDEGGFGVVDVGERVEVPVDYEGWDEVPGVGDVIEEQPQPQQEDGEEGEWDQVTHEESVDVHR